MTPSEDKCDKINGPHQWDMQGWLSAHPEQITPRFPRCGTLAATAGTDSLCERDGNGEDCPHGSAAATTNPSASCGQTPAAPTTRTGQNAGEELTN